MPRSIWSWVHPLAGVGILAALLWRLGSGPFVAGLRLIDAHALGAALGIGVLTTWACAWRWSLVAGGLGVRLPLHTAVAHCYRATFLNARNIASCAPSTTCAMRSRRLPCAALRR